jgi:very-short-patch-repair endonuclease
MRALLTRQHGLITSEQASGLGISSHALSRRVDGGELERVLPRVYRSTLWLPTTAQYALGAVLWAGDGAVASHSLAARLWEFDGVASDACHVWVPYARAPRAPGITVHRGEVAAIDRRRRDGVPVTSAARTLVDLSGLLDDEGLEVATEAAFRRGLTTPDIVRRRLDAVGSKGRPGTGRLRHLLADREGSPLESRLEVKVWRLLRGAGLRPVRQYRVRAAGRAFRLDFAWPVLRVAIEADGYASHAGRWAFDADRRRLAALAAEGWVVIPVSWNDCVHEPDAVVRRVIAVLTRAAA